MKRSHTMRWGSSRLVRKIEICISNLDQGTNTVWDHIRTHHPNIKLRKWECLGYCGRCVHNPYVLIDDTIFLEADDENLLVEKVEQYIERKKQGQTD